MNEELYTSFFVHGNISIPNKQSEHTENIRRKVKVFSGYDGPLKFRSMVSRIQRLKTSSITSLLKRDDTESCPMNVPYYRFYWQLVYTYSEPILMQRDDMLEPNCVFDSTGQTSTNHWGDGTEDEMCLITVFASVPQ